ncbi:MAG: hypothetical protein C4555_03105 [Dehalococcoidia bacterium]|nr:MAG: hypothetical protein C4555_03105 [Dehalococcoidia bacterium]
MANTETQTLKEELIKLRAEVGQNQLDIKEIWEVLEKKRVTLYGNGNGYPGVVNKLNNMIEILQGVKNWQNGWREVTNYEEYRTMRAEVKFLSRWNWLIIGGLSIITIAIQVFGHKLAGAFF